MARRPLLDVRDLRTHFRAEGEADGSDGVVRAVDGVSFDVEPGETVCLVGESGCGKTVTAESITRLIERDGGRIVGGSIRFDGREVTAMDERELRSIRGGRIGHVFQNPGRALNPVYTVGWQIVEALRLHRGLSRREARAEAVDRLAEVGIPDAAARVDDYPHEFSVGMTQRVAIAMALAGRPDLLIADEPTTALDVTVQAQLLRLLEGLQEERGMGLLFITHDLGVVAEVADRVVVMYGGKVMERTDVASLFERPAHPYTRGLMACLPERDARSGGIPGRVPDPRSPPAGCRFHPRCPHAIGACRRGDQPALEPVDGRDHVAACVFYGPGRDPSALEEGTDRAVSSGDEGTPADANGRADGGGRP